MSNKFSTSSNNSKDSPIGFVEKNQRSKEIMTNIKEIKKPQLNVDFTSEAFFKAFLDMPKISKTVVTI